MNILYNRLERRLRAPYRLLIQLSAGFFGFSFLNRLALFVIIFALMLARQIPFSLLNNGTALNEAVQSVFDQYPILYSLRSLLAILCLFLFIVLLARILDRRSWKDYGFHFRLAWWRDLVFGLALGGGLMGLIFAVQYALGWVKITGRLFSSEMPFYAGILTALFHYILIGIFEEWFARGYQIRNIAEGLNLPRIGPKAALLIAYLLTSVGFGLFHAGNSNATIFSIVNLVLFGLMLGLGFLLTGDLAIPIGLHITWNFFQGNIFGLPVSGAASNISLLSIRQAGENIWTGGAFGPEGGLLGLLAISLAMLLIYAWCRWTRGKGSLHLAHTTYPQMDMISSVTASGS